VATSSAPFPTPATEPDTAILIFVLDGRDFALPLANVERVVRRVAAQPLPSAPAVVNGVIDLGGEIVPLLDPRRRFRLPDRPARSSDSIIIGHTRHRRVALVVDSVLGLNSLEHTAVIAADDVVPGLDYVSGIARVPGRDLVLIHDLDRFLALDEEKALDRALEDVS
jgi:purine-binding chemotaxis protein CheW